MAAKRSLTIDQGTDWSQRLEWQDSDNDPVDLTGWTARMDIRESIAAADELLELTTGDGITLGDPTPTDGVILLEITNADSEDLPPGNWFYDLEMVSPGGLVTRLLEGRFKVRPEVTR